MKNIIPRAPREGNAAPPGENGGKAPRPFARRGEVLLVVLLLAALVAGLLLLAARQRPAGATAAVTIGTGSAQQVEYIPLAQSGRYSFSGSIPVTLLVEDGAICFVDSTCPDHRCEAFGLLRHEGDWALCAPAGVLVRIEE